MDKMSAFLLGLVFLMWSAWELYSGYAFSVTSKSISHLVYRSENEMAFYLYVISKGLIGLSCLIYFLFGKPNKK
jgi:hypothetical protein